MNPRDKRLSRLFRTVQEAKSRKANQPKPKKIMSPKSKIPKAPAVLPKVSIITYVYCTETNGRWSQLKDNIASIRNQRYPFYEHIIVDDGSPIPLEQNIKSLNDNHIRYYKKAHTGITQSTATFNCGLQIMTGKYGMILSSDDAHLPGTILKMIKYMEARPTISAVTGNCIHQVLTKDFKIISERKIIRKESITIKQMLIAKNCVNACATMFRKSALDQIELPPDQTGFAADYDLWVKLSEIGPIIRIPDVIIKYRNFGNATRILTQKDQSYRQKCIQFVKSSARIRRLKR